MLESQTFFLNVGNYQLNETVLCYNREFLTVFLIFHTARKVFYEILRNIQVKCGTCSSIWIVLKFGTHIYNTKTQLF